MKYQELYDYANAREWTIVELDTNIIPNKGWLIPSYDDAETIVEAGNGNFDSLVDKVILRSRAWYHADSVLYIENRNFAWIVGLGKVFSNQQYAMGYAHGKDFPFIVDCFTGKKIVRR